MDSEAEGDVRVNVRQVNDYLLAGMGLVVLAIATASVFDTSIRLFTEGFSATLQGEVQWRFRVALILTLAAVGLPAWWRHWRRIEAAATDDPVNERTSLPRKLYVLGVLCLGLLSLVGGASATLFVFLRDLLAVDMSMDTIHDLATALAVVLTIAIIIPYHWIVYRKDRELEPDIESPVLEPVRKHVTLLTPPGGGDLVRAVEEALGQSITLGPVVRPRRLRPISRLRGSLSRRPGHRLSPGKSPAPHPRTLRPTRHLPRLTEPIRLPWTLSRQFVR